MGSRDAELLRAHSNTAYEVKFSLRKLLAARTVANSQILTDERDIAHCADGSGCSCFDTLRHERGRFSLHVSGKA